MSSGEGKNDLCLRATCLNCIDGRVQLPVLYWIRENYNADFVDVITEAGMDRVIAVQDNIDEIIRKVKISVDINKSIRIFLVGHHDCKGNPVDEKIHFEHIKKAVARLKAYWPELEIIGLWVNGLWQVGICCK
jgi:carbonic anhydrase